MSARREPRLLALYRGAALATFGALLLFALLNAAALVDMRLRPAGPFREQVARYGWDRVAKAHPEIARADLPLFARENDAALARLAYEPFTESRPRAVRGRFVNVTEAGFRAGKDQRPWPPPKDAYTVFVFGGSTAFGYFLPDGETIPSHLQALLPEKAGRRTAVYNFGRPTQFSSQERTLFSQLLVSGLRPDAAVFIDGVNEWRIVDPPAGWTGERTQTLSRLVDDLEGISIRGQLAAFARATPIVKWLARHPGARGTAPGVERTVWVARDVDRWLANQRLEAASAKAYGVAPLFVWQPVPTWKYPGAHLFPEAAHGVRRAPVGYDEMARRRAAGALGDDVLWLADMQEKRTENLYVDALHYTAAFSRDIAAEIARALAAR